MKIEIIDKLPKMENTEINLELIEPDWSSISKLRGNNLILENYFQMQKLESLYNG